MEDRVIRLGGLSGEMMVLVGFWKDQWFCFLAVQGTRGDSLVWVDLGMAGEWSRGRLEVSLRGGQNTGGGKRGI